jgi:hypothetical protein
MENNSCLSDYVASKRISSEILSFVKETRGESGSSSRYYEWNSKRLYFDYDVDVVRKDFTEGHTTGVYVSATAGVSDDMDDPDELSFEIDIDPLREPYCYQDMSSLLVEVVRHEIEHLIQGCGINHRKGRCIDKSTSGQSWFKYYARPSEVEAYVAGFRAMARHRKVSVSTVMEEEIEHMKTTLKMTDEETSVVFSRWTEYISSRCLFL